MIWPSVIWTALGVGTLIMLRRIGVTAYHTWRFWKNAAEDEDGKREARIVEAYADLRRQVFRAVGGAGVVGSGVLGGLEQAGIDTGLDWLIFPLLVLIPAQLFLNVTLDWYDDKSMLAALPADKTSNEIMEANTASLDANTTALDANTEKLSEGDYPPS